MNLRKRYLGVATAAAIAASAALFFAGTAGAQAANSGTAPKPMASREASAPSVSELTARPTPAGGYLLVVGPSGQVAGSSTARGKEGWIEVSSWSWGEANTGGAGTGKAAAPAARDANSGMAAGKRMHQAIVIRKEVDSASPKFIAMCASGQHISRMQFETTENGQPETVTITDAVVSSVQKSSGGDRPMESVTFTFQKIDYTR